jgi:hypothetical protein
MADVLTGMPSVDELIRQLVGQDDGDDDDADGITELVEIIPTRLDGVDFPASGIGTLVAKRAAGERRLATRIIKSVPEKRITLHVAYPVLRADQGRAQDGHRDFVGASALEDGAHAFMKAGAQIGLFHKSQTEGAGTCVESWIHRGQPWSVTAPSGKTETVQPGDWCVGIQWTPASWELVKAGRIGGVSMQGSARRRKPAPETLAGVRKAAKVPRCGECAAKAKLVDARFCTRCGAALTESAAVAKAAAPVMREAVSAGSAAAGRAGYLLKQYADPERREHAYGELVREFGVETATGLLAGDVAAEVLGADVAKAVAADSMSRCKTCKGSGRLRHPETGAPSRKCPECQGTGQWTPRADDEIDMTPEDATLAEHYTRQARSGDGAALGKLSAVVGPDVAARLTAGVPVSAQDFRRGYLSAARAPQSAAPGQEPRIPQADHVVTVADFRRGPLGAGQSRPAPGSTWPGQGGQADYYGGGPGGGQARVPWSAPGLAASTRIGA